MVQEVVAAGIDLSDPNGMIDSVPRYQNGMIRSTDILEP